MKQLYIIGAGSVGGHIATNPSLYGLENREILFLDNDSSKIDKTFVGKKIVGSEDILLDIKAPIDVIIGIAFPAIKRKIYDKLKSNSLINFPTLVSKNAWISEGVKIGQGVIVYPNCSINYGTILDDFSILNMNCAVGHECKIGQFSSLAPGVNLGGNTIIGVNTELGIGSSTRQFIHIGDDVKVGGQSMVVNDLESGIHVKGVPAKKY
tara:strand:+ start:28707 stop:29333 length:627 start_codon:yes stop_codon:yes gene_type:complete